MKTLRLLFWIAIWTTTSITSPALGQVSGSNASSTDSTILAQVDSALSTNVGTKESAPNDQSNNNFNQLKPPDIKDIISIPKIIWSIIFLIIGYLVLRVLEKMVSALAERYPKYRLMIKSTIPIIKIFGWIFVIFIITVGIFQPPWTTILAFSASVGVAIGFASQDILKNIFAGITVLFDQPFKVGDKIEASDYYGEVVEIGLRSTRIITPDDSLVTIPNGVLMNESVSNANSGANNCQVVAEIYLPVTVNTTELRELATEAVKISRFVYLNKPIVVLFSHEVKEKQSFMKMKIKAYVYDIRDEFKFKSDIVELVMRALVAKGILT